MGATPYARPHPETQSVAIPFLAEVVAVPSVVSHLLRPSLLRWTTRAMRAVGSLWSASKEVVPERTDSVGQQLGYLGLDHSVAGDRVNI